MPQHIWKKAFPSISAKDVYNHKINLNESNYVSEDEYLLQKGKFGLREGSLLVTKSGSIGRTAIFDGTFKLYLVESIGVINVNCSFVDAKYIQYLLDKMFDAITYSGDFVRGLAVKHLPLTLRGSIPIPLPPISEQQSVVRKVDQLMKPCHEFEEKIWENQNNSELLMEAVLKEAFPCC